MTQEADPIVVFGAPRSGTTYLTELLNAHPDLGVTNEARLFVWAHRAMKVLSRDERALLFHREAFLSVVGRQLTTAIRSFYADLFPDCRYWGDKNPHYLDPEDGGCLDTILELFPGTRFVHIYRDGREVVCSLMKLENSRGERWASFEEAHDLWMEYVDTARDFALRNPDARHVEVRYESLVADDVAIARAFFDDLGVPFHKDVEAFCRSQRKARVPLSDPTRDLDGNGVLQARWRDELPSKQCRQSLAMLGDHLVRLGYETPESLRLLERELEGK